MCQEQCLSCNSKISNVCSIIIEGDRFHVRVPHRDAAQSQSHQQHLHVDSSEIHRQALDAMEGNDDWLTLEEVTMWAFSPRTRQGRSARVSTNGVRTLTASIASYPCAMRCGSGSKTPTLSIRQSSASINDLTTPAEAVRLPSVGDRCQD